MDKLLRALASEQLQIIEVNETRSPEHEALLDKSLELYTELEQKLNSEELKLIKQLMDTNSAESAIDSEEKFIRGYRLGVLMTMEVFAGQNTFFFEEGTK